MRQEPDSNAVGAENFCGFAVDDQQHDQADQRDEGEDAHYDSGGGVVESQGEHENEDGGGDRNGERRQAQKQAELGWNGELQSEEDKVTKDA